MEQLQWNKSAQNDWLALDSPEIDRVRDEGVYVIWQGDGPPRTVRVGQGDVKARIKELRRDENIKRHGKERRLFVTWASVTARQRDGVERYLAEQLRPIVSERVPSDQAIAVNLPFAA